MPTTNKTPHLGLNNWVGTDKPKRGDFTEDNFILDTVISKHLADDSMHLTESDREQLRSLTVSDAFLGNGKEVNEIKFSFVPSAVAIFVCGKPLSEYIADKGYTCVNGALVTKFGSSSGASLKGSTLKLTQSQKEPEKGGLFFNLNNEYMQYLCFAFR